MRNLAAGQLRSHAGEPARNPAAAEADETAEPNAAAARMISRVRWLMIVSGLTTLVAVAAVIAVIGYRVFHAGGSAAPGETIVTLPKGARVISSAVADDRIAVTLDVGGATEMRVFDLKTLKEVGRLRFATEP
jgi:hypothetical protein